MTCQGTLRGMTPRWRFHLSGGRLCLDFANTVSWRRSGQPIERLQTYRDLIEWARQSGVLSAPQADALEREARRRPVVAARLLARGRMLREAIYRVFSAPVGRRAVKPDDLACLDRELHDAVGHVHFTRLRRQVVLAWPRSRDHLAMPLWVVACSAANTLVSVDTRRLRTCPASNCGWIFLDTSKSGSRRWCDMRVCGSREKARRYYARQRR
jgi:predicted RNA-binding Zn ribbon-like protein